MVPAGTAHHSGKRHSGASVVEACGMAGLGETVTRSWGKQT